MSEMACGHCPLFGMTRAVGVEEAHPAEHPG